MSIKDKEFLYNIFRKEIKDRKIPLSLGKTCPVKCTFCYEMDHSYRDTFDTPLTTQEHWDFIFNEIKSLPRASYLLASNEETTIKEYWNFFSSKIEGNSKNNPNKVIQNLILDSVEKRLVSDVPCGVFLSGGIDSSILVAAASKTSLSKVNTFSVVFKNKRIF